MSIKTIFMAHRIMGVVMYTLDNITEEQLTYDLINEYGLDFIGLFDNVAEATKAVELDIAIFPEGIKDIDEIVKVQPQPQFTIELPANYLNLTIIKNILDDNKELYFSAEYKEGGDVLLKGDDLTKLNYIHYLIRQAINKVNKLEEVLCLQ